MTVKEVIAHAKAIRKYCKTHEWCQTCPFGGWRGCSFTFTTPDVWTFRGIREKKVRGKHD